MSMIALAAKVAEENGTGNRRISKGSSKEKGKVGSGYESEIVSRLFTLCIAKDKRFQALEDRATYVCIIKSDSMKKDTLTSQYELRGKRTRNNGKRSTKRTSRTL